MRRSATENNLFRDDDELLRFLRRTAVPRGGSVAVVAGQFALILDESRDRLIPLIGQELGISGANGFSSNGSGDYPERSFALGARFLHSCAVSSSAEAHLLLLVDDRHFQEPHPERPGPAMTRKRADDLRRRYYGGPQPVPPSFLEILGKEGLDLRDALLSRGDPEIPPSPIMPANSVLFSRQELRDRYVRNILPELLKEAAAGDLESMAEGDCRPGDMLQLILDLARRRISHIVVMVPGNSSRRLDPNLGTALHLAERLASGPPVVHLVTNMDHTRQGPEPARPPGGGSFSNVRHLIRVSTYRPEPDRQHRPAAVSLTPQLPLQRENRSKTG